MHILMPVAVVLCLGAFASSASAYSLASRGCVGTGGGTITKALTDWNYANIIMPARNITRAPSRCSTSRSQRIVVQYQLWFLGYYDYRYRVQADSVSVYEGMAGPGGYLSMPEVSWGGSYSQVVIGQATPYRTQVIVWWEKPSNRAVYGYKVYTSNSNGDYACYTVKTINGSGWCGVANGAVSQIPGIAAQIPSA